MAAALAAAAARRARRGGSCAPAAVPRPARLGGNLPLLATYARALLAAIMSYAFLYGFTQWLEEGRGLSPSMAGLVLLPVFGDRDRGLGAHRRAPRRSAASSLVGALAQTVACGLLLLFDGTARSG